MARSAGAALPVATVTLAAAVVGGCGDEPDEQAIDGGGS